MASRPGPAVSRETSAMNQWRRLGAVEFIHLIDARLQLHHALQIPGAINRTLTAYAVAGNKPILRWDSRLAAIYGKIIGEEKPVMAALRLTDLTLLLLDGRQNVAHELHLDELTIGEAYSWIEQQLELLDIDVTELSVDVPHEMPIHPAGEGEMFVFKNSLTYRELAKYWTNTEQLLLHLTQGRVEGRIGRCSAERFDYSRLFKIKTGDALGGEGDPVLMRIGMCPGDADYAIPYFYVALEGEGGTSRDDLTELGLGGIWHAEGWTGAVLGAETIVRYNNAVEQFNHLVAFVKLSIKELLVLCEKRAKYS